MKRYRLATSYPGPGVSFGFQPDPEGLIVLWEDIAPLLSDPVLRALADYAAKLAAWDTRPQEGDAAHAFGDAGLVDGLAAALRAERVKS